MNSRIQLLTFEFSKYELLAIICWNEREPNQHRIFMQAQNKTRLIGLIVLYVLLHHQGFSQDSIKVKQPTYKGLDSFIVHAYDKQSNMHYLAPIKSGYLTIGKKSESIFLMNTPADISNKTGRQLFSKVAGIFVYDMDGSGNQLNISGRGLDPHRGWEFNNRKDGILTNSDMYGYPASHFSMPLESIERIELIRGTGSLQYGAQFGGLLNYISKQPDSTRALNFESINSTGSYQLLSNYFSVNGTKGKWSYYAFIQKKSRNGYRKNEHTDAWANSVMLHYKANEKLGIRLEWARSQYRYRLPGPLTDLQFHQNPTQASRFRNYYSPDIHLPSLQLLWKFNQNFTLQYTLSALLGNRSSVLFDKPTNILDSINLQTLNYNNRQVDIDNYHSFTNEIRTVLNYSLAKQNNTLVAGLQILNNNLHRRQQGKGTTGNDYDLSLSAPGWGRNLDLITQNIALFLENKWQLGKDFFLTSGIRLEKGSTRMNGSISYLPQDQIPIEIKRNFPLLGAGFSYRKNECMEWYGGFSEAYHPMYMKDLIPTSTYEVTDKNIQDSKGYNLELGNRGTWKKIHWDISLFELRYNNRFGLFADNLNGNLMVHRTNLGDARTKGVELFFQLDIPVNDASVLSIHTASSYMDGRYLNGTAKAGNINIPLEGNKIESVPDWNLRNGIQFIHKTVQLSLLHSFVSKSFADPLNTIVPPESTAAVGIVPSYTLLDMNASVTIKSGFIVKLSLNNMCNRQYFTKRPMFYPGPGIWPSDGRNFTITTILKW